jgi:predicted nucleic acid-binding protein
MAAAWGFLSSGAVQVLPIAGSDLPRIRELMFHYHDRPMDFADATLVLLAERESLSLVFTVDHDDFETYRLPRNRRFRLVPGRPSRSRR